MWRATLFLIQPASILFKFASPNIDTHIIITMTQEKPLNLRHMLATLVTGQQRTAASKQFTFLQGEYVLKGPYWPRQVDRLNRIFERAEYFRQWKTPCMTLPLGILESDEGPFIVYTNLAAGYPVESIPIKESFSDYEYRYLVRHTLLKLNHCWEQTLSWNNLFLADLLEALCHCYILQVGDAGMCNILADLNTRRVYVIDYDELQGTANENETFYFKKPPGQKFKWLEQVRRYYPEVLRRLSTLSVPPHMQHRLETCRRLLSCTTTVTLSSSFTLDNGGTSSSDMRQYKGRFGGVTYHGIPTDVAKSGFQKAVRRGQTEWVLMYLFDLYGLGQIEKAGAIWTNTVNRLAVCAAEDVGLAQLDVALAVINRVNNHKMFPVTPAELAAMGQLLSISKKTRICSHLWYAFVIPEGKSKAASHGISHMLPNVANLLPQAPGMIGMALGAFDYLCNEIARKSYPRKIGYADFLLFTAAGLFVFEVEGYKYILSDPQFKTSAGRNGGWTSDPNVLLWSSLRKCVPAYVLDILATAYFKQSESRPFLSLALLGAIYGLESNVQLTDMSSLTQQWMMCPLLRDYLTHNYNLSMQRIEIEQPYIIDKHTAKGRALGGTTHDFVTQGAVVNNEDPRFVYPSLQELYRSR